MSGGPHAIPAHTLLSNLPSAVIVLDGSFNLCFVNPAAEQLLGASAQSLLGRALAAILTPHATLVDLARQVQSRESSVSEYAVELSLARGEVMQVDTHLTPIVEAPGHTLVVLQPCSVTRNLDMHLAHRGTHRSIAGLAVTLAHEVKNPLSGIRGAAQLLEPAVDEDDKQLARLICDEADRIVKLVDRMEAFAQPGTIERKPVNIHQVLARVRMIAENGFARHVRIAEVYDPSIPDVQGDRDRLIQLFLNLVKNAAEAIEGEAGPIVLKTEYQHGLRMRVSHSQERVELPISVEVRDGGPGVAPDMVDHLFEPFITSKPKGQGLGLSLVAKIAADHGGMVSYAPLDPGSMFRVRLPAFKHKPPSQDPDEPR